jgi:hypothetical protein
MTKPQFQSFVETDPLFDAAITRLLKERSDAESKLTRDQFIECLRQALACGDFIRQVVVGSNAQGMIYIPFAREQELEGRVKELQDQLRHHGISPCTDSTATYQD